MVTLGVAVMVGVAVLVRPPETVCVAVCEGVTVLLGVDVAV